MAHSGYWAILPQRTVDVIYVVYPACRAALSSSTLSIATFWASSASCFAWSFKVSNCFTCVLGRTLNERGGRFGRRPLLDQIDGCLVICRTKFYCVNVAPHNSFNCRQVPVGIPNR